MTQEPVSEEEAEADGFSDGTDGETTLDTSKELTGIHHADINIRDYGEIQVELDAATAPITVTNFVKLAQDGFYDGLTFWRIIDGFMMQGGDPKGDGTGGADETIKGEFSSNGVKNDISQNLRRMKVGKRPERMRWQTERKILYGCRERVSQTPRKVCGS